MTPGNTDATGIGDDGAKPKLLFLCQTLPYPPHGGVEAPKRHAAGPRAWRHLPRGIASRFGLPIVRLQP